MRPQSKEVLLHAVIGTLFEEIGRWYAAEVMGLESPRDSERCLALPPGYAPTMST